jgi:hypothetical protein
LGTPSTVNCTEHYLPHWDLALSEEEQIYLARHLSWLLHVNEVLKELLHSGDLPHVLQHVPVILELLGGPWLLALHIPEFPVCLQRMKAATSGEATATARVRDRELLLLLMLLRCCFLR